MKAELKVINGKLNNTEQVSDLEEKNGNHASEQQTEEKKKASN